ncbi:MAG: choice-of-anchor X domain-containing protein [Bacteroidota bacterium]
MSIHRHHRSRVKMRFSTYRRYFSAYLRRVGVFFDIPHRLSILSCRLIPGLLPFVVALTFFGCDQNPMGALDPRGNAPVVSQFSLTPSSVRIDSITPSGGFYPVKIVASTFVTDPDGADQISIVSATVMTPDGTVIAESNLHDDGAAPDKVSRDGVYTGALDFSLSRSDYGIFHVVFSTSDRKGLQGTSAITSLIVRRPNIPPWLYNLVAPDTVLIPDHGTNPFVLTISGGDSDGVGDIKDVTLRVVGGNSPPSILHLLDEGNISNKDSIQGEVFSITLQVDSSNTPKTYDLLFQAIDRAGDTSATLTHYLTLR